MALKKPPVRTSIPQTGMVVVPDNDEVLKVEMVKELNLSALFINLLIVATAFTLIYFLIGWKLDAGFWKIAIPTMVVVTTAVLLSDRCYANVDTQKVECWLDSIFSDTVSAVHQGFHFIPVWFEKEEKKTLDLDRHLEIKKTVKCQTRNGYTLEMGYVLQWQNRGTADALGRRFRYSDEEINVLLEAIVASHISDLSSLNDWEDIIENKGEAINWLASIFGGEGNLSKAEQQLGIRIFDPVLREVLLDPESEKLFKKKAQAQLLDETVKKLTGITGLDPKDALNAAEALMGSAERKLNENRQIHKIEGDLPKGIRTLVLGNASPAVR